MLLCGTTNLREISLFPMNQQAVDLLMGSRRRRLGRSSSASFTSGSICGQGVGHSPVEASIRNCASANQRVGLQKLDELQRLHLGARRQLDVQRLPGRLDKAANAATAATTSGLATAACFAAGPDAIDDGAPGLIAADVLGAGLLRNQKVDAAGIAQP